MTETPGVRYYDVRQVTGETTHIDIDKGVVESAGVSFFSKAVVRVLGPKGWGILETDRPEELSGKKFEALLASALRLAQLTGDSVSLADAPRTILAVPKVKEDCRDIDLEEKASLLGAIEKAADLPQISSRRANYLERIETVRFRDSSGCEYSFESCRSGFSVIAVASKNGDSQMAYEPERTIHGFNLRHREEAGRKAAELALALLGAKAAKGGTMNAVLDPELAGVLAHEAVGHACEGDLVEEGNSVLKGRTGEQIGDSRLTIVDDPSLHEFGFEPVDAEGVAVGRTELIRNGRVNAFLHNRGTLAAVGHGVAGHARAMPGEPPLVRMSNTFVEAGDASDDEIFSECKNGIFLAGTRGGQVDTGRGVFQFNAEYGYLIENGEKTQMVRDVSLSGEILKTLHGVALCGKNREMHAGYCGKGGQSVPVSDGAPLVFLQNAVVGGSGVD